MRRKPGSLTAEALGVAREVNGLSRSHFGSSRLPLEQPLELQPSGSLACASFRCIQGATCWCSSSLWSDPRGDLVSSKSLSRLLRERDLDLPHLG